MVRPGQTAGPAAAFHSRVAAGCSVDSRSHPAWAETAFASLAAFVPELVLVAAAVASSGRVAFAAVTAAFAAAGRPAVPPSAVLVVASFAAAARRQSEAVRSLSAYSRRDPRVTVGVNCG